MMSFIDTVRNALSRMTAPQAFIGRGEPVRDEPMIFNLEAVRPSFDAIGQRDETVRQRISVMIDRLDDLKSLQDDFAEIMSPVVRISEELSRASVRIVELEHLISQERQAGSAYREEASDLKASLAAFGNELSDVSARATRAESEARDGGRTIEELRTELNEKIWAAESLERQLFAESAQTKVLAAENKSLRSEAQAVDTTLARAEHDLRGAYEGLTTLERDNARLQALSEEQGGQLADLIARHEELDKTADLDRQKARALEAQLALETTARERRDAQFEAEMSAFRTERASLLMKLESAENKATSTLQMLTQARNQLRDKDEAFRVADRNFKEAIIARSTSDRQLESVQADLERQTERFVEIQRVRTDLDARCDMLGKALAAKDAALDQAGSRSAALADRIEELTEAHKVARAELETANRRLKDELQNERSERALMQGALDIARESRVALQKQHEALKRSGRGWRESAQDDKQAESFDDQPDRSSNVRAFASSGKPL